MKKVRVSFLFLTASLVFASCTNRDENGSTDTSNTNASHSVTDSTRGDKPKLLIDTISEKHVDTVQTIPIDSSQVNHK